MSCSTGSMTARASSGSSSRINSVDPLMSANSAVTVLRSPSVTFAEVCSANRRISPPTDDLVAISSERDEAALRLAPHFLQNLTPALTGALQAGQRSSSLRPHCSQKTASAGLSLPHFEQHILPHSGCDGFVRSRL